MQRQLHAPRPARGVEQPAIGGAALIFDVEATRDHELAAAAFGERLVVFVHLVEQQTQLQDALGSAAEQGERERLEPRLACDLRLGAALFHIGAIEVFETRLGVGLGDFARELARELALFLDALAHHLAPLFQFAQITQTLVQQTQLRVVEAAGGLLAIARDEGNGGPFVEQGHGGGDLRFLGDEFLSETGMDRQHGHSWNFSGDTGDRWWSCGRWQSTKAGIVIKPATDEQARGHAETAAIQRTANMLQKLFSHSSELSMQRTLIGLIAGLACLGAVTNIAQAAEQKTVESLYQDKAKLGGHEVQVRGKVVKVNYGVMMRNFLHIQDGTGKQGSNDLTVTSQETAEIGDGVVVTCKLSVDKDFGAGYTYPILLEDAHISKGK